MMNNTSKKILGASAILCSLGLTLGTQVFAKPAARGGGCSQLSATSGMSIKSCLSFDALANTGFGGYVGDGFINGRIPAGCSLRVFFYSPDGHRDAAKTFPCQNGRVAVNESDIGEPSQKYKICVFVNNAQKTCVDSPNQFR